MKIAVDDSFMTVDFQIAQPRHKLSIFCEQSLMMIIGHNEKRTDAHPAMAQGRDHLINELATRWGNVVDRDHQKIAGNAGRCHRWQKFHCRCGFHPAFFCSNFRPRRRFQQGKFEQMTRLSTGRSTYPMLIFTISPNSALPSGITDKRDCRTSGICLSRGSFLIWRRVTG